MQIWMIYGATGFTGELIVKEAIKRGHFPILAGRNHDRIIAMAEKYKLPSRVFSLENQLEVEKNISDLDLVLHCAGPFVKTSSIMAEACLKEHVNYLDITGEISVFEEQFKRHERAVQSKIALISGVGFDVIPTDCLANYLHSQMPDAEYLDIAFVGISKPSAGTVKSMIESLPLGGAIRKNGELEKFPLGQGSTRMKFHEIGEMTVLPIPWGDLSTAYHSTKIPNIATFAHYPEPLIQILPLLEPSLRFAFSNDVVKKFTQKIVEWVVQGPDEAMKEDGKSYIYARVWNSKGEKKEAWLDVAEGYYFTAMSAVLSVEKTLRASLAGTFTPAQAFGHDFVLEIPRSTRYDSI